MSDEAVPVTQTGPAVMEDFYGLGELSKAAPVPVAKATESVKQVEKITPTPEKPVETPPEETPAEVEDDSDLSDIDLLTDAEPEKAPEAGKSTAKPDVMEKRYKDLQAHTDRVLNEHNKTKSELESLRAEKARLEKALEEKEFNSKLPEISPMPTTEDWQTDAVLAAEKLVKHQESKAQRDRASKALEESKGKESESVKVYKEKYIQREEAAISIAMKEFPALKDPNSRIHKVVKAYLESHPEERNAPEYIYNVALKADRFINKKKSTAKGGEAAPSILIPGSGGLPKSKPKAHTVTALKEMSGDKLDELLLKQT